MFACLVISRASVTRVFIVSCPDPTCTRCRGMGSGPYNGIDPLASYPGSPPLRAWVRGYMLSEVTSSERMGVRLRFHCALHSRVIFAGEQKGLGTRLNLGPGLVEGEGVFP